MAIEKIQVSDFGFSDLGPYQVQPDVFHLAASGGSNDPKYAARILLSNYTGVNGPVREVGIARYFVGSGFQDIPNDYYDIQLNIRTGSDNPSQRMIIAGVKGNNPSLLTNGYVFKTSFLARQTSFQVESLASNGVFSVGVKDIVDELVDSQQESGEEDSYLDFAFYLFDPQTSGLGPDREAVWFTESSVSPVDTNDLFSLDFYRSVNYPLYLDNSESSSESTANNIVGLGDEVSWHTPETQVLALKNTLLQPNHVSLRHKRAYISDVQNLPYNALDFWNEDGSLRFGEGSTSEGPAHARYLSFLSGLDLDFDLEKESEVTVSFWFQLTHESRGKHLPILGNVGPNRSTGMWFSVTPYTNADIVILRWYLGYGSGSQIMDYPISIHLPDSGEVSSFYHVCARTKLFDPDGNVYTQTNPPMGMYRFFQVVREDGEVVYEVSEDTFSSRYDVVPNIGGPSQRVSLPSAYWESGNGVNNYTDNYIGYISGYDNRGIAPRENAFEGSLKDIRMYSRCISPREVDRLSSEAGTQGGIKQTDTDSAESRSNASEVQLNFGNFPAESCESSSHAKSFSLSRDSQVILSGSESSAEAKAFLIKAKILASPIASASQCSILGPVSRESLLPLDSSQTAPHCQSFSLAISGAANTDDLVSLSIASQVNLDAHVYLDGLDESLWYCPSLDDVNEGGPQLEDFSSSDNRAFLEKILGGSESDMWQLLDGNGGSRSLQVGSRSHCTIPSPVFSESTTSASVSIHWKDTSQYGGDAFLYNKDSVYLAVQVQPNTNQITVSTSIASVSGNVSSVEDMNHVVMTYQDNGEISLYIDGDLVASAPHVGSNHSRNGDSLRRLIGGGSSPSGQFDDLRLYDNRVLTPHEVKWLYDGQDRGGRGVTGPAPLEAVSLEAGTLCEEVNIVPDLTVDPAQTGSQVTEPGLSILFPLLADDLQSSSTCSETDIIVRNFDFDRDPLIIGDRMSNSLERAVLEFSIQGVTTRLPVYLHMGVEDVNLTFLAEVGRWTSDFPTSYTELQSGTIAEEGRASFSPEVGDVVLDVTEIVSAVKLSGSDTLILCLIEQANFSNKYYQVDNSPTGKPYLSFSVTTDILVDSVQSHPQCESVFIDVNLSVDSSQSSSHLQDVSLGLNSSSMLLDSAESAGNANYVDGTGVRTGLSLLSAQSVPQCSLAFVQMDYITFGYHKDFRGYEPSPAEDMKPFRGDNWYYYKSDLPGSGVRNNGDDTPLSVKVKIHRAGLLNTLWNFMGKSSASPDAGYQVHVEVFEEGSSDRLRTLTYQNDSNLYYQIPAGTYELVFSPEVMAGSVFGQLTSIYLEHVELQRIPAIVIDSRSVKSPSQCSSVILGTNGLLVSAPSAESSSLASNVNVGVPATADSAQSTAQCSNPSISREADAPASDVESLSEVSEVLLSGESLLEIESAESITELHSFRIPSDIATDPNDIQSLSQSHSIGLGLTVGISSDSLQSFSEAEDVTASGKSVLSSDSAESVTECSAVSVSSSKLLGVDSIQSASQASRSSVSQSIMFDEDSVGVCTPEGNDESVFTTEAGERINKGDLVTIYSDGLAYLSDSETQWRSVYSGFALTSANTGEIVVVVEAGDLKVGDGKLSPNQLYIVSPRRGRIRHADQLSPGDYMSIVGIAMSSGVIRIGTNFVSTELDATSDNPPTDAFASIDADALRMDDNVISPTVTSGVVAEPIVIGDAVTRGLLKAGATSQELSAFGGIAISDALDGCTVAVCRIGDIYCGSGVLVKNRVYALSRTTGKLMLASDLQAGDYATLVGLAITSSTLRVSDVAKGTLAL